MRKISESFEARPIVRSHVYNFNTLERITSKTKNPSSSITTNIHNLAGHPSLSPQRSPLSLSILSRSAKNGESFSIFSVWLPRKSIALLLYPFFLHFPCFFVFVYLFIYLCSRSRGTWRLGEWLLSTTARITASSLS